MDFNRRGFLAAAAGPLVSGGIRRRVARAGLGNVFFCRVSDAKLLGAAKAAYPHSIASHEPRPGFRGITFCGARATLTIASDRLF